MIAKLDAYIAEHGVELKPYVKEILKYLKEKDVKIGLATSTKRERATKYLIDHDIYKYFDALVFGDMVQNGKPAPDIFLKACELLAVKPEEAVAVEDSINGIISAGTAGLYPVMVIDLIQPNEKVEPYVKKIYNDLSGLREVL